MLTSTPLSVKFILAFSTLGFLFSGYLSFVKLFSGSCAFNESCPIFWGIPACWYGFVIFSFLLYFAVRLYQKHIDFIKGMKVTAGISFIGVLFAGTLSLFEILSNTKEGFESALGIPTCFMGLVCFMLIFLTAVISWSYHHHRRS